MATTATARRPSGQVRRRIAALVALVALVYSGVAIGQALTATDLGNSGTESIRLERETFANGLEDIIDADNHQLVLQVGDETALGDTPPGIEAKRVPYATVRTNLTDGNYTYTFGMHEHTVGSWQSGDDFTIQVYGWDGASSNLLGTLYTKQNAVYPNDLEGAVVSVDSGSTDQYALTYSIVLSRQ